MGHLLAAFERDVPISYRCIFFLLDCISAVYWTFSFVS